MLSQASSLRLGPLHPSILAGKLGVGEDRNWGRRSFSVVWLGDRGILIGFEDCRALTGPKARRMDEEGTVLIFRIQNATGFKSMLATEGIRHLITSTTEIMAVVTQPPTAMDLAFSQSGLAGQAIADNLGQATSSILRDGKLILPSVTLELAVYSNLRERILKMDRDEWFRRYYDDVILMNNSDKERRAQALLKYEGLPEVTISSYGSRVPKQWSYTGRKPIIPSALADTLCTDLIIEELLEKFNTILGTSYTLGTAGVRSILGDCILKEHDFGTAYAHLRPFWYGNLTTTVDDLSEREVQYRRMLEDVLVNGIIIYPHVPPRRIWDLYSNRVVPWCVARRRPWAISHAWMDKSWREDISTAINSYEWPVPIPKDMSLDQIRIEMLNLGAEYIWLDVLCLRQEGGPMEYLRVEEWKVDVPTIGSVYAGADKVVCYLRGLGRPLTASPTGLWDNDWFKRAWTLQEISEHLIIGGDTGDEDIRVEFEEKLSRLQWIHGQHRVYDLLSQMRNRVSTNPVDKVAGMAYLLHSDSIPAYYGEQSEEDAWTSLVDVTAHQCQWDLLFLYPQPGDGTKTWQPSWRQVMTDRIPQGQHRSSLQIGCWNQDGKTDANAYYNGYIIELAFVQGLCELSEEFVEDLAKEVVAGFSEELAKEAVERFSEEFVDPDELGKLSKLSKSWANLGKFWTKLVESNEFDSKQFAEQFVKQFDLKQLFDLEEFAEIFGRCLLRFFTRSSLDISLWVLAYRCCQEIIKHSKVLKERRYRVGQLVVKDDTGTECSFEITASHQYPIPDDSYTLLGTTAKWSGIRRRRCIHWVFGRRLPDGRLKKLSVAQMNVEAASMDSLVSRSIAKRASITILA
ncbi:hypothetical protein ARMGADRAFT_1086194 [Armillaria gallica]|uniref:Heterokaryon incompatibility domain-containing protein n=1 Tax=Armillaria gallica TaxID=47427 RepID=A0A2H3DEJ6_ARMGA|nr:hypothetical protein ARMGADRAFT_1086194 [Armillaria gallica]